MTNEEENDKGNEENEVNEDLIGLFELFDIVVWKNVFNALTTTGMICKLIGDLDGCSILSMYVVRRSRRRSAAWSWVLMGCGTCVGVGGVDRGLAVC